MPSPVRKEHRWVTGAGGRQQRVTHTGWACPVSKYLEAPIKKEVRTPPDKPLHVRAWFVECGPQAARFDLWQRNGWVISVFPSKIPLQIMTQTGHGWGPGSNGGGLCLHREVWRAVILSQWLNICPFVFCSAQISRWWRALIMDRGE